MFEKILPQAENLLREIIELKNKKSDENLYWNNRFGILEFDDEIVFSILNDFSENILDHNIHTITFPNYTKKTNSISITKNNREIFLLECKKYKSDQLENAMIKSYLNHINATKKLLSRIDTLENTVEKFSNIVNDLLAIKNDCDNLDWRRETNKSEKLIS